jgi:hypothetical protein
MTALQGRHRSAEHPGGTAAAGRRPVRAGGLSHVLPAGPLGHG